jgi:hypothetical protein
MHEKGGLMMNREEMMKMFDSMFEKMHASQSGKTDEFFKACCEKMFEHQGSSKDAGCAGYFDKGTLKQEDMQKFFSACCEMMSRRKGSTSSER